MSAIQFIRVHPWLFVLFLASPAFAQMSQEELRRERVESVEELRRTEDISGKSSSVSRGVARFLRCRLDYGAVYSPSFTTGENNDRDGASPDSLDHTWDQDIRWFAKFSGKSGRTRVYARLKTTLTLNTRASLSVRRSDFIQPTFDMLYIQRSIPAGGWRHRLTFGRQFVMVERGISFGAVADGLHFESASRVNEVQIFFLRQNPSDDNIDILSSGSGRTKRWFYGAEWKLRFLESHKAGLFVLNNMDRNDDSPDGGGQRHRIDSMYYGVGLDGRVLGNLGYWTQWIQESGKTYPADGASKVDISAQAFDVGLRYFFRTPTAPSFYIEYVTASGDADAAGPGTGSSTGGSSAGEDERFTAFGGLSLGYALAPQLTNLNVIKLGHSVKPFAWTSSRSWSELSFQPTYFIYRKDHAAGATSDPAIRSGAGASGKIGSEFDLTVAWKAAVDISYQLRFGRFNPSAAYANRASETYLRLKFSLDL